MPGYSSRTPLHDCKSSRPLYQLPSVCLMKGCLRNKEHSGKDVWVCFSDLYMCMVRWPWEIVPTLQYSSVPALHLEARHITDAHFLPKSLNRVKNYLSRALLLQTTPVIREGIPRLFWSPYSHISMVALLFICDVYLEYLDQMNLDGKLSVLLKPKQWWT